MAVLARRASDVRINELDLSTVLNGVSPSTAAMVGVSARGPITPKFYSNPDDFLFDWGPPDASVSFDHYCALDFLREGNSLWAVRALGSNFFYSAALVKLDSTGNTAISGVVGGVADTANADLNGLVLAGESPLYLFYPKQGPGSYGNNFAISIDSQNIDPPTNLTGTTTTIGGNLIAATYEYQVSAIGPAGETLAAPPITVVIGSVTTTNTITISWNPVVGAIGYKVYGRAPGTPGLIATVGGGTFSYLDTGVVIPDLTMVPITTPAGLPPPSPIFTVKVFDTTVSTSVAVETFVCSLTDQTDETGAQMEVTQRINPFSRYVSVRSNVPFLLSPPTIKSAARASFLGGASGTAPTSANINAAFSNFSNKELYVIDILMNNGRSSPTIQRPLDALAQRRSDCVAYLDTPPGSQKSQGAVDYRNLDLNLNSSYSMLLAPDVREQDPITGKLLFVPPSGVIAGLQARTTRITQPWFSIAGLNRGLLNGNVLDVRETYDDGQATQLYLAQVSYIRKFIGRGIAFWEQNTLLNKNSALQFLNVRVLCNIIKRATYDFLLYSLQEPGDDLLRKQIQFGLEDYLRIVQAGRGIRSFQVICNDAINPPALVNSGILAVAIVIVPILAVREIQLTLAISKTGVEISEAELAG